MTHQPPNEAAFGSLPGAPVLEQYTARATVLTALLEGHKQPPTLLLDQANQHIKTGYAALFAADLITDPIIEVTLAMAVLPFVPFNFQQRTKKGRVYRKLQAALWKYERERQADGNTWTNYTFEAARIAKALKTGIVAAYNDVLKDNGEEPDPD